VGDAPRSRLGGGTPRQRRVTGFPPAIWSLRMLGSDRRVATTQISYSDRLAWCIGPSAARSFAADGNDEMSGGSATC